MSEESPRAASATSAGRRPFNEARWIWTPEATRVQDEWVLFRRTVSRAELRGLSGADDAARPGPGGAQRVLLRVTADSRYRLMIQGRRIGEGPPRSWPEELFYDEYDLTDSTAETEDLEIELLVRHFHPGTGYAIPGAPGCAVEAVLAPDSDALDGAEQVVLVSDGRWRSAPHPGYGEVTTKAANALPYAEVYRADLAADSRNWQWRDALDQGPAVTETRQIVAQDIPDLVEETLPAPKLVRCRRVSSPGIFRSVNLRPLVFPGDRDINKHKRFSGLLTVEIVSPSSGHAAIGLTIDPHDTEAVTLILSTERWTQVNGRTHPVALEPGSNRLLVPITGEFHDPAFHFQFVLPEEAALGSFRFAGPFTRSSHVQVSEPVPPAAQETLTVDEVLARGEADGGEVPAELISLHHVAWERLSANGEEEPCPQVELPAQVDWGPGDGYEMIWDFGREVSGFLSFEIDAEQGSVVDVFCFESMHDGRIEHTYSLNNSLRYVASSGRQSYDSPIRRGFRYAMVAFHGSQQQEERRTATLLSLSVREILYPREPEARLETSDPRINAIWQISKRTVALCMEDTYVDCPAYEQTYWTGDARNTALYSYYLFGAQQLFLHGARLAARSLDRSPLIESMIPSAWQNVIPSWSFLHVIAGAEYLFYSGDPERFRTIYRSLMTNMERAAENRQRMDDGSLLFGMYAWNMVDWAPMEVPDNAIVAHQNAQFIWACHALSRACRQVGEKVDADRLETWRDEVQLAVNTWFWDEPTGAYRDAVYRDGSLGTTFSVQTQLFAYLAGVADHEGGDRGQRVLPKILTPPPGFVRIGSAFVHHVYLDLLDRLGRHDELMQEIRNIWGNMLDHGATTCWEGWSLILGDYTRSHCHAWSSAPAYFLPTVILGVRPVSPGFRTVEVRPIPVGLDHAQGTVPTPQGLLEIAWTAEDGVLSVSVAHPEGMEVSVVVPEGWVKGTVEVSIRH